MGAMSRNGMVCAWSAWLHSAPLARTILFCANEPPQVDRISNTKVSTRLSFLKANVITFLSIGKPAIGEMVRNCSRTIRSRNQAKLPHRVANGLIQVLGSVLETFVDSNAKLLNSLKGDDRRLASRERGDGGKLETHYFLQVTFGESIA